MCLKQSRQTNASISCSGRRPSKQIRRPFEFNTQKLEIDTRQQIPLNIEYNGGCAGSLYIWIANVDLFHLKTQDA